MAQGEDWFVIPEDEPFVARAAELIDALRIRSQADRDTLAGIPDGIRAGCNPDIHIIAINYVGCASVAAQAVAVADGVINPADGCTAKGERDIDQRRAVSNVYVIRADILIGFYSKNAMPVVFYSIEDVVIQVDVVLGAAIAVFNNVIVGFVGAIDVNPGSIFP